MDKLYCLIMAGGSGTRFWPRSRIAKPKQYLNLFGSKSLLQSTIERFNSFTERENIYIVSSQNQSQILEEQAVDIPRDNLIYEPVGKNTLPCIGLAAMFAERENPDGIMVVSPSDHLIENNDLFRDTILTAAKIADEREGIVTIGITPSYPATGYGYVKVGQNIDSDSRIRQFKVDRFVEKPDESKASMYLNQGGFFWNSGLFIFKISVFLKAVEQHAPDLYKDLRKIQEKMGTPDFYQVLDTVYKAVEGISIDYGIMEHANNIYLVEGSFIWNDLGSWESVYLTDNKDEAGNVTSGDVMTLDSSDSYIYTDNGLIAVVGLDNVVVVKEGNAILVCSREKTEEVKRIVEQLKEKNKDQYL